MKYTLDKANTILDENIVKDQLQQRLDLVKRILDIVLKINTTTNYTCITTVYSTFITLYMVKVKDEEDIFYQDINITGGVHEEMLHDLNQVITKLEGYCD